MKKLKFRHNLVELILDGTKTVTWRLFDDKDLKVGDQLEFVDYENGEKFVEAEITRVREKKLGQIEESDFEGHEKFKDTDDMLQHYREYYGDGVTTDTIIKMIDYKVLRFLE